MLIATRFLIGCKNDLNPTLLFILDVLLNDMQSSDLHILKELLQMKTRIYSIGNEMMEMI